MKLFSYASAQPPVSNITTEEVHDVSSDMKTLSIQVDGYLSVGRVHDSVAAESMTFVDKKNITLYNEYVNLLATRMGVEAPKSVSTESFETEGQLAANYSISLEGWMKDMWEKIKAVFVKIYESVKAFFTKYFTRLGRLKKSLQNLQEAIGSTNKDIGDPSMENPPSALLNAFAGHSEVNNSTISASIANISVLVSKLGAVNKAAEGFSSSGLVSADFVKNIQALKDKAVKASGDSEANRAKRDKLKTFGDRDKKKELDTENKDLKEIQREAQSQATDDTNTLISTAEELDAGDDKANQEAAQKEFDDFMKIVIETFDQVKGKVLVNGQKVLKVESKPDEGLVLEMSSEADPANDLRLSGKAALAELISSCQALIKTAENDVKNYGNVNDKIMDSFKTIDRLTGDIDKIDPEKFGKYKKVINERIRGRLGLLKKFFTTYNKLSKNVLEMSMDVSEQTVNYAVLSLKHFK